MWTTNRDASYDKKKTQYRASLGINNLGVGMGLEREV